MSNPFPAPEPTPRLAFRSPERADAARLVQLLGDGRVARNVATMPHPYGEKDALDWIARVAAAPEAATWLLIEREGGRILGALGFLEGPAGVREVGYWIAPEHWGKGYATEALRAAVAHAERRWPGEALEAAHFADNPASGRVLEKCGFVPVGRGPRACRARAAEIEAVVMRRQHAMIASR